MIDLICNWLLPCMLDRKLLLRWMGQGFLPKSSSNCYCFPFLLSLFLLVPSVPWAWFSGYCSLAWSLSLLLFFLIYFFKYFDWSQMNLFKDVRTGKASVKRRPSQLMLTCLASDHAFVVNPTFLAHPWNGTNKQNTTISKKNPNTWEIRAARTVLHALWSFPCCLVAGTSGLCKEVPWINYSDD